MRAVNLLPPDNRGASKASAELGAGPEAKGGAGAFVVLGVLAAAVAGTAGVVLADNTIKQRSADLQEAVQQQQVLQRQATQLKPYADYDAMAKTRIQTVKDLAGSKPFYVDTLGLTLEAEDSEVLTFKSGGGKLFVYRSGFAGTNQATGVTWPVRDVEAEVAALKAKYAGQMDFAKASAAVKKTLAG